MPSLESWQAAQAPTEAFGSVLCPFWGFHLLSRVGSAPWRDGHLPLMVEWCRGGNRGTGRTSDMARRHSHSEKGRAEKSGFNPGPFLGLLLALLNAQPSLEPLARDSPA